MDGTSRSARLIILHRQSMVRVSEHCVHIKVVVECELGEGGIDNHVPPLDMYLVISDL